MISTNRAGQPWDEPGHDVSGACGLTVDPPHLTLGQGAAVASGLPFSTI